MLVRRLGPTRPRWETPFGEFDVLRREMQRLLDATYGEAPTASAGVFPAFNVTQDANNFYVRAPLPGVAQKDLEVSAVNRTLTVSGTRSPQQEEGASYHRKERAEGNFSRSVTLPLEFDNERVQARFVNGLLTVTLPKPEKVKPRQIAVSG
jgi:HSP20 family protein